MRIDDEKRYPSQVTFFTTKEQVDQIAEASARLMTSKNAWLRAAALEKLRREEAEF
jgi:hypothetical protein